MTLRPGERLVIDASVAVKWVVPAPDSDRAEASLDHPPAAPDLFFSECGNALQKKVRRGELSKDEADMPKLWNRPTSRSHLPGAISLQ